MKEHEKAAHCLLLMSDCQAFASVCYKRAGGSRSDPVRGPDEDVWWPRGGPDAEVDYRLEEIRVAQSGCLL